MKKHLLLGVWTLGLAVASAWGAGESIKLETANLQVEYAVAKGDVLELKKLASRDGSWSAPLGGRLFPFEPPAEPAGNNNGPRYAGPIEWLLPNGDRAIELRYQSHEIKEEEPGVQHLVIRLKERVYPLGVELHLRAYADVDVFEQWLVVENGMETPIYLPRLDSMYWHANAKQPIFLEWYASEQWNTAGIPFREQLSRGTRLLESRDGNRHKHGPVPAFILGFGEQPSESEGVCMIASLDWTGSSRLSFEINSDQVLETSVGVNQPGLPVVEAGDTATSPMCVFTLSGEGKGPASRQLHDWARNHFLQNGTRLRLVDNNSWEGCKLKVSEKAIIEMMEDSAELGIELYVLDDGWFGNGKEARVNTRAGLGDWQFNTKRFPNELDKVMQAADELDIEFGIWFEPEMINENSKLFQQHPEWVMRYPDRSFSKQRTQMALDVANPDVQRHMFESVNRVLTKYPRIRFVKWDANSNINNGYSPYLGEGRQGDLLNAYMDGYLKVMKELTKRHPNVDFQACAAGGGRADLGAMRYSHTFWPSDDTDPLYRLGAQWNFSGFMPVNTITSHVTHKGKGFSPKFRVDVSMMTQFGMEVDTRKCTPDYLTACRVGIAAYKQVREIVQLGDQYRHAHPYDSPTPSMNYVSKDQQRSLVLAYQTGEAQQPVAFSAPVSGLDPARTYQLTEMNLPDGDEQPRLDASVQSSQSGQAWMERGIPLQFTHQYDSAALLLEVID
ncbi:MULTISPECIES: alpha-galactosidase [unclassified Lentimonas]|uniref:alpha-galactosidase n=1 Tax=unclassified Lentimonas TaxID=2630993 RepID=UPI001325A86D|nr:MULTISPECIES: alpha-galactosidase [unclassified Lentimonas]CAA6677608.1 Alpha-galactosidase (EC [Lentimonas sp. CC4]CAA6684294.1 Alpha-galactosidase (EC [Lentimonas sp. CC6]CAA7078190.1 Alpha-galactosidase (EC [Lentimonas sp. CC4]CAA7168294.1 Alpha-galactosidase (EC [Lentimonas sp. CC21]CAA7181872.1 Alpha-galactosidase (EC [Lentimonas sp. CC8]